MTPEAIERHEPHCYGNPKRTPRIPGEITSCQQLESHYNDKAPAWWPGAGKIWDGEQWLDIPGYEDKYSGRWECRTLVDVWPDHKNFEFWPVGAPTYLEFPELPWDVRLGMVLRYYGIECQEYDFDWDLYAQP